MSDRDLLASYVEAWWQAIGDFTALLEELPEEEWATPTDLAGWDVRACASHIAHLESVLAGRGEEQADVGEPAHITSPMGLYTEIGVVNRRDTAPAAIIAEIREAAAKRHQALQDDMPTDAAAKPELIFGGVPWDWRTLLRNRPLDVWMHEQDVRRAVGRPGGMDSVAAQHTADYLTESFGYVVGKQVKPAPGTVAVLAVEGSPEVAVEVHPDGRARPVPGTPEDPTVRLEMDRETFIVLAGGRRAVDADAVRVTGSEELAGVIVDRMATTP